MLGQKLSQSPKTKLSNTLRSWLLLLQANIEDLKESLDKFAEDNSFLSIEERAQTQRDGQNCYDNFFKRNAKSDVLEQKALKEQSVWELLDEQIIPSLFPTAKPQTVANQIIQYLNHKGYFKYNETILREFTKEEVEKIRTHFKCLEPVGVGATDFREAFLFALENIEIKDDGLYEFSKVLILDFENIQQYTKEKLYKEAIEIIKKFSIPPSLEHFEESRVIVPDTFIFRKNGEIKVKINGDYYPEIHIETDGLEHKFLSSYLKETRNLVDVLAMRKATLYGIGLMIVEHQYEFLLGEEIKPMTLEDLAQDLERNAPTISRAIANEYLSCDRGFIPLKDFFAFTLNGGGETSNASVKDFVANLVRNKNKRKPLGDSKILELILTEFRIDVGRRTIAKYRKQLGITSSIDRKKFYELEDS